MNGAGRIWCTLRSASAHIVKSTIIKVSKINDDNNLQMKSKYKTLQNGRCMWWFVIHDSEEAMQALEAKWESVKLQTGWCLECCTKIKALLLTLLFLITQMLPLIHPLIALFLMIVDLYFRGNSQERAYME